MMFCVVQPICQIQTVLIVIIAVSSYIGHQYLLMMISQELCAADDKSGAVCSYFSPDIYLANSTQHLI